MSKENINKNFDMETLKFLNFDIGDLMGELGTYQEE